MQGVASIHADSSRVECSSEPRYSGQVLKLDRDRRPELGWSAHLCLIFGGSLRVFACRDTLSPRVWGRSTAALFGRPVWSPKNNKTDGRSPNKCFERVSSPPYSLPRWSLLKQGAPPYKLVKRHVRNGCWSVLPLRPSARAVDTVIPYKSLIPIRRGRRSPGTPPEPPRRRREPFRTLPSYRGRAPSRSRPASRTPSRRS